MGQVKIILTLIGVVPKNSRNLISRSITTYGVANKVKVGLVSM